MQASARKLSVPSRQVDESAYSGNRADLWAVPRLIAAKIGSGRPVPNLAPRSAS